jgi:dolichol-phosphate mannosyltransferase
MIELSVIIPVYNEFETILTTVERVLQVPMVGEVIIVDDGSDDGTGDLLKQIKDPRVRLFEHEHRCGKGAAIRTAIPKAHGDYVVIQDADMEYDPAQLPAIAEPLRSGRAQVVYGSRFAGSITGMEIANRLGNHLLTGLTNLLFRAHITDEATCYKMFRRELLQSIPLHCVKFEFCPEITAKILRRGIHIHEVPIEYHGRPHSAGKKIRWWDLLSAVTTLARYRFFA